MPQQIVTTVPKSSRIKPNQLFIVRKTGEYAVRLERPGTCARWISLGTTDRLEAMRRLERTGVEKILEVTGDASFKEAIVESLTSPGRRTLESVIDEWLADKALRVVPGSLIHPRTIAGQFIRLFRPGTAIEAPTPAQITGWINGAPTLTRRQRRLSVLEDLFQFAFDQGYRKDNPGKRAGFQTDDLTFDQMERTMKVPFTRAEFDRLLACQEIPDFWRWSVQLAWWLGLRISDCCCLQWGSFCAVPGKLVVWQVKTRQRNELDLADPVLGGGELARVFAEIKEKIEDAVWCFPGWQQIYRSSRRPQTVHDFRYWSQLAGLDGSKTFHSFRKSAAIRWQDAGRSLKEIGAMLGHEGTGTVATYLETRKS